MMCMLWWCTLYKSLKYMFCSVLFCFTLSVDHYDYRSSYIVYTALKCAIVLGETLFFTIYWVGHWPLKAHTNTLELDQTTMYSASDSVPNCLDFLGIKQWPKYRNLVIFSIAFVMRMRSILTYSAPTPPKCAFSNSAVPDQSPPFQGGVWSGPSLFAIYKYIIILPIRKAYHYSTINSIY